MPKASKPKNMTVAIPASMGAPKAPAKGKSRAEYEHDMEQKRMMDIVMPKGGGSKGGGRMKGKGK